ncbi:MAG: secretin N-terminal domain-containing protein [Terriglobia bacterium]
MEGKGFWTVSCLAVVLLASGCPKGRVDYQQGRQAEFQKDYDSALIHYQRALRQDPSNIEYQAKATRMRFEAAQMHVDRGHKLRDQGQLEAAITEFEKALAIDPSSFVAEQELRRTLAQLAARRQQEGAAQPAPPAEALAAVPEGPPRLRPLSEAAINLVLTADSKQVFETIGKLAGINIIFDPDFQPRRIPVELKNATLEQALDIVALATKSFWKAVTPNTIMVIPDTKQKRTAYEEQIIKTIYLSNITTAAELNEIVQTIRTLLDTRRIAPNTSQNAILIRDTPDKVAVAEKIIRDIDKAKSEVLIQVTVLQARRDRLRQLGIEPSTSVPLIPIPRSPVDEITGALRLNALKRLSSADYAIILPSATAIALLTDTTTRIIQNPEVRATDGQTAKLRIGDRVPFAVGSFQPGIGGVGINPLVNTQFQFQDVGVNLDITPRVHSNREISLKLMVEVSSVTGRVNIGGIDQPIFGQRRIEHEIRLREGEVNILGGIVERTEVKTLQGWPGLSQIPFLRYLFSSESVETQESEILIVLTPRIIRLPELTPLNLKPLPVGTDETVSLRAEVAPTAPAPTAAAPPAAIPQPAAPQPTPQPEPTPEAAEAPHVRFEPAQVLLHVGETTSINLEVAGAQDLFTIPLVITFDPQVVELAEVHHGGFLAAGGQPVALVHRVEAETGTAIISLRRPPGSRGVSGRGALVTLVFRGLRAGRSALQIAGIEARTAAGGPLSLESRVGEIVVQ